MKALFKLTIVLSICLAYFAAFGHFGEAWSAPKGKLVVSQGGDATTLDPQVQLDNVTIPIVRHVYDYLINRVCKKDKVQNLPMLATSWEAINNTTWVFHLRKGVKFHNGEDFDAEAVKYSIDRVLNPATKSRIRWAFTFIERVDILDSHTVKIITKEPAPTLIINLGFGMPIVPPKYFKEKGDIYVSTHPVGTGPYKFVRWIKDQEIVFEANEDYWAGPPNVKTVVFKPIPEDSTRVAALIGGDVDIAKKIPFHLVPMVNKSKRAGVLVASSALSINIHLDTRKPGPLQDKRVRQAINYAVDKEAIIKNLLEGYAKPLAGPLTPSHFGHNPNLKPYPYDPEKAKALLKEAGYDDGITLTLHSPTGRYVKDKEFAQAVAGQLAKVGINVKVVVLDWTNYMKRWYNAEDGAGPMCTIGWAGTFDADGILYPLLHSSQRLTNTKWTSKEFDTLLDRARSILDQKERKRIYQKVSELAHEEAVWLFLFYGSHTYGVSNRVQNWKPGSDEGTALCTYGASVKE